MGSFQFTNDKISTWKSTGIFNYLGNSNMNAVGDSGGDLPDIKNDGRLYVYLSGNHFQQNKVIIPNNTNIINIYCVYELQPIVTSRDTSFTVQMHCLVLCKLLKMLLIIQKIITKDTGFALMKGVSLVTQ